MLRFGLSYHLHQDLEALARATAIFVGAYVVTDRCQGLGSGVYSLVHHYYKPLG